MFEGPFDLIFTLIHRGIFAAVGTGFIVVGLRGAGVPVYPERPPYEPIPESLVSERIEAENAAATHLGFGPPETSRLERIDSVTPVEVPEGGCVAVVAGSWGWHRIRSLSLVPSGAARRPSDLRADALSADPSVEGLVAATQVCSRRARSLEALVTFSPHGAMEPSSSFAGRLTVQRADEAGLRGMLDRGWVMDTLPAAPVEADAGGADAGEPDGGVDAGPEAHP